MSVTAAPREIFVPGIGQYDNLGDIVLRRQLLRWLEPLGRLHVFVGRAPAGYAESLCLDEGLAAGRVVLYRSYARWYARALAQAARGRASYVFKPGEIQITWPGLKEHVSTLPLVALIKARGGRALRVGAGARGFLRGPRALMRPSLALTDLIAWRDARTAEFLGVGDVMPDLAFAEGPTDPRGDEQRDVLVVEMRGDRPAPSDEWIDAVRTVAAERDLQIVAVVQVERDGVRSRELAERLGGTLDPWPSSATSAAAGAGAGDHRAHEEHLRELYRRCALVVSDRLHVLITALTEGACPAAPLVDSSAKITRHFRAAGMPEVAFPASLLPAESIAARLRVAADDWPAIAAALAGARERLELVRRRVVAQLGSSAPHTVNVWHVGRQGEIAGGMTQVVNAYLAWPFDGTRQHLLPSRTGTPGLREALVFAGAVVRMPFLGRRSRTVVAVHLSQGGSFVREGALLRWAALLRYPTVAHLHGSSFAEFALNKPERVRSTLRSAQATIALSGETAASARDLLPEGRIELLPNAVPSADTVNKERIVVFGGGVTRRKGVDVLIEAWRRAAPEGWSLHIAGPVLEEDLMQSLPEGAAEHGALPHADLMALLDRSAIAVLPSRDEAMPMFLLEAMARGNAVISTPVGGIPALLGDGAGLLVEPGDIDALADALRHLISDATERESLARAGLAKYESEFAAGVVYPRVEQVWLSVVN